MGGSSSLTLLGVCKNPPSCKTSSRCSISGLPDREVLSRVLLVSIHICSLRIGNARYLSIRPFLADQRVVIFGWRWPWTTLRHRRYVSAGETRSCADGVHDYPPIDFLASLLKLSILLLIHCFSPNE